MAAFVSAVAQWKLLNWWPFGGNSYIGGLYLENAEPAAFRWKLCHRRCLSGNCNWRAFDENFCIDGLSLETADLAAFRWIPLYRRSLCGDCCIESLSVEYVVSGGLSVETAEPAVFRRKMMYRRSLSGNCTEPAASR